MNCSHITVTSLETCLWENMPKWHYFSLVKYYNLPRTRMIHSYTTLMVIFHIGGFTTLMVIYHINGKPIEYTTLMGLSWGYIYIHNGIYMDILMKLFEHSVPLNSKPTEEKTVYHWWYSLCS